MLHLLLWLPQPIVGCMPHQHQQQQLTMVSPTGTGQRQLSEDFPYQEEQIFNMTTIGPDDETLDTLVAAADAAAQSIDDFLAGGGGLDPGNEEALYDDTGGGGGDDGADGDGDDDEEEEDDNGVFDSEAVVPPSIVAADTVADDIPKEEYEEYYDTYDIYNFNETEYYYTYDGGDGDVTNEEGSGSDNGGEDVVEDNETINVDTGTYRPHKNRTVSKQLL
jgi:hypothetical protein